MSKIFVSYRRQDSAAIVGRMYDRLRAHFGTDAVFMDIESILGGEDFTKRIESALDQCDLVVAVIGPRWAGDEEAHRRIDDPKDFVRIEIESALKRDLPIIPVLISQAKMPIEASLPASLAKLTYRDAIDLDEGRDFKPHIRRLIRTIDAHFERAKSSPPDAQARAKPPNAHVQPGRRKTREVPALLHYHCDRFDQESQIEETLRRTTHDGPLVVIVHGDEYQCHDKFLERLSLISLPRILELDQDRASVKEYLINFPSALSDARRFREQLLKNLGLRVLNRSTATADEIAGLFVRLAVPIVIHARLLTDEWVHGGRAIITSFLDFWQQWPARDARFRLLVFLNVTYQRRCGRGLLSWPRRIARERANAQLRRFLDLLSKLASPTGLVILDELRGVTQNDLEVWAQDMYTQQFCGERDLLREVRDLCRRPGFRDPEGRIAMEVIAEELKRMLGPGGVGWEAC
jgi:hypothetical protein